METSESGGDGDVEAGHLAEIGALAPEQSPHGVPVTVDFLLGEVDLVEPVHPLGHDIAPGVRAAVLGSAS